MRILIFIILLFLSSYSVAQIAPNFTSCYNASGTFCDSHNANETVYRTGPSSCKKCLTTQQVCPAGTTYSANHTTPSCYPDVPTVGTCPAGQAEYMGLCRDIEATPEDCGANFTTAIEVGGGFVCSSNGGCPEATSPSTYNTAGGSWTVCSSGTSNSSSGGASSSGSNTSSGGDSSSGNGSGGGGDSSTGGGMDGNSSAANSSLPSGGIGGGSNSSGSGGSASSSGSGSGDGEGEGAGECDPTAKNYLECITSSLPGIENGDPLGFDGEGAAQMLAEVEGEYQAAVDGIKSEMAEHFGSGLSGSGTLQDICKEIRGTQVCFGFAKWSSELSSIGNVFFFVACVMSLMIVVRR